MQSLHKNKKSKRTGIYIIAIFLIIVANPFHITTIVRNGVMTVLSPLSRIGYGIGARYNAFAHLMTEIGDLYDENQRLRNDVQRLESLDAQYADIEKENALLRTELDLLPRATYTLIGAEVIARDPLGGGQWMVINRGSEQGVEENMAVVVNDQVFVGYIDQVDDRTARVRLLTHPDSVVNVVGAKSGAEAIMRGNHGLSAVIEDIKKDSHVENGEMFMTSSIGTLFPRGLSVGRVQNVALSEDQLFQKASIVPLVSFDDLRVVFVVKE